MKTRWYVSLKRPGEGRYRISIYEAPEIKGSSPASFQESAESLSAVENLLKTLKPQRSAHLLVGKSGEPIVEADDVPPGETIEHRIAQGLGKLEGNEGSAQFVVVGPPWDEMEAIVSGWREQWKVQK